MLPYPLMLDYVTQFDIVLNLCITTALHLKVVFPVI